MRRARSCGARCCGSTDRALGTGDGEEKRLEPGHPGRELEQQRQQPRRVEPEQQRPDEREQQRRFSCREPPRRRARGAREAPCGARSSGPDRRGSVRLSGPVPAAQRPARGHPALRRARSEHRAGEAEGPPRRVAPRAARRERRGGSAPVSSVSGLAGAPRRPSDLWRLLLLLAFSQRFGARLLAPPRFLAAGAFDQRPAVASTDARGFDEQRFQLDPRGRQVLKFHGVVARPPIPIDQQSLVARISLRAGRGRDRRGSRMPRARSGDPRGADGSSAPDGRLSVPKTVLRIAV